TSTLWLLSGLPVLTMTLNFLDMVLLFNLVDSNDSCWSRFKWLRGGCSYETAEKTKFAMNGAKEPSKPSVANPQTRH
ncbi:hypothetical protein, partial [Limnohabitans sp.]|uniref:hypothetical protein n=1 Tax=Limnohabitans sp. TaxID=1907725 RepID=UPI0031FCB1C0